MPYKINHIHLKAPDPRKTADWYTKAFNFKIVSDETRVFGDRFVRCQSADGGMAVNISGPRTGESLQPGNASAHFGLELTISEDVPGTVVDALDLQHVERAADVRRRPLLARMGDAVQALGACARQLRIEERDGRVVLAQHRHQLRAQQRHFGQQLAVADAGVVVAGGLGLEHPVATLSDHVIPKRLKVLVESESLLNDGTALVVFTLSAVDWKFTVGLPALALLEWRAGGEKDTVAE